VDAACVYIDRMRMYRLISGAIVTRIAIKLKAATVHIVFFILQILRGSFFLAQSVANE
jgi:hypothetical protein